MAKLKIEAQQEERRAEREAKQAEAERAAKQVEAERAAKQAEAERAAKQVEAERALAEKKLLLAHELSLKELEIKARQSESSNNGGSILTGPAGEKKVRIPKNVVPSFVVGDDIDKWLAAYEVALRAHGVPEGQWGVAMWGYVPPLGRDTLLTLDQPDQNTYPLQKATLLAKFGLTPEGYRQRFRDSTKQTTQTWVDFFDFSSKALNGWVRGNKVADYKGLYDLILREHMLNTTFRELRQHLVDSKLTDPRKLAEEADLWASTRVSKKVSGSDPEKGSSGSPQQSEGEVRNDPDESQSKGGRKGSHTSSEKQGGGSGGQWPKASHSQPRCFECSQIGHRKGDSVCPKNSPNIGTSTGVAHVALGECSPQGQVVDHAFISFSWEVESEGKLVIPEGGSRHFHQVGVNGIPVTALRDTGASLTMIVERLVSPEQYTGQVCRVTPAIGGDFFRPMARVSLEWGGEVTQRLVIVSPQLPIDCILGNEFPLVSGELRGPTPKGALTVQMSGSTTPQRRVCKPRWGGTGRKDSPLSSVQPQSTDPGLRDQYQGPTPGLVRGEKGCKTPGVVYIVRPALCCPASVALTSVSAKAIHAAV
ncbi:hypothetical protein NDU88_005776 [Pleurodeles waltl]|uniref:Peptidase A2 domain-containing protein n=1 Tax=Pleurodeles waltl TaxID=8319 RepID=A0AAV7VMQ1_PLEWA|nr:hypothetical protein NDU88_005776 [Pleurodeles waltl]